MELLSSFLGTVTSKFEEVLGEMKNEIGKNEDINVKI
jgi:hypothetical protein